MPPLLRRKGNDDRILRFVGVDPGASGGAYVSTYVDGVWTSGVFLSGELTDFDIFDGLRDSKATFAVIEEVHSMPTDGVSSAFKFGTSYGRLRMALCAAEVPYESVTPHQWQGEFVIGKTKGSKCEECQGKGAVMISDPLGRQEEMICFRCRGMKRTGGESRKAFKNRLKAKAQELFPKVKVTLANADALLIAEYARRLLTKRGVPACASDS